MGVEKCSPRRGGLWTGWRRNGAGVDLDQQVHCGRGCGWLLLVLVGSPWWWWTGGAATARLGNLPTGPREVVVDDLWSAGWYPYRP